MVAENISALNAAVFIKLFTPLHFSGFFSLTMSVGRGTLMSPLLELSWQLFSLRGYLAKWSRELTGESNRLAVTFLAVPTWKKYPTSGCKCIKRDGQTQYLTLTLWWPLFQFLNICACVCVLSCVQLFVTPMHSTHQEFSMEFSRQEYWSGLPFPTPGDLPDPGMEPESAVSPSLAGGFFTTSTTWEAHSFVYQYIIKPPVMCIWVPWFTFIAFEKQHDLSFSIISLQAPLIDITCLKEPLALGCLIFSTGWMLWDFLSIFLRTSGLAITQSFDLVFEECALVRLRY